MKLHSDMPPICLTKNVTEGPFGEEVLEVDDS